MAVESFYDPFGNVWGIRKVKNRWDIIRTKITKKGDKTEKIIEVVFPEVSLSKSATLLCLADIIDWVGWDKLPANKDRVIAPTTNENEEDEK